MTDRLREAAQAALEALEWGANAPFVTDVHTVKVLLRAALAEQDAEPVRQPDAWVSADGTITRNPYRASCWRENEGATPLYAAPPRREWQGLTDEEIDKLFGKANTSMYLAERLRKRDLEIYSFGARDAEAALKEKNHD